MTRLMSFPFRVDGNGNVATQDDASEEYEAAELAVILLTRKGERELVPDFGITDPAFSQVDEVEFITAVARFGPTVLIKGVTQVQTAEGLLSVDIEYANADNFDEGGK